MVAIGACGADPVEVTVPVTRLVDREVTREIPVPQTVVVEREVTRETEVQVTREVPGPERVVEVIVTRPVEVTRIVEVKPQPTVQLGETPAPVTASNVTPSPMASPTAEVEATPQPTAVPALYDVNSDREALIALYQSTRGQRWTNNQNWLSSRPLSDWYGIETNAAGRVTKINLKENDLRGPMPINIGRLEFLTYLGLSNNAIRGSIPSAIGALRRLDELDLSRNNLSGSIPTSIGNLRLLRLLSLNGNELSDTIPDSMGNLTNLVFLDLTRNSLVGQIPRSLGNILFETVLLSHGDRAEFIDYGWRDPVIEIYNRFSGCIPDGLQDVEIRALPDGTVRRATIDGYRFRVALSSRKSLRFCPPYQLGSPETDRLALIELYNRTGGENWTHNSGWLSDAPISEWHGVKVNGDGRVTEIVLANNGLAGSLPETIDTLSQLGILDLAGNALTGNIPAAIGGLVNLGTLLLQNNQLSGIVPQEVTEIPGLILNIVGNLFE